MLSTLFGKKARVSETTNPPWDEIESGSVNVAIWRSGVKQGVRRYVFGLTKPYQSKGKDHWGRTFGVEDFWDLISGLEEFAQKLSKRPDVSHDEQAVLVEVQKALEQALTSRRPAHAGAGNGVLSLTR